LSTARRRAHATRNTSCALAQQDRSLQQSRHAQHQRIILGYHPEAETQGTLDMQMYDGVAV
jgi:hypothetical protein